MEIKNKKHGLKLNIEISSRHSYFDPKKIRYKYIILEKEDSFYFLKSDGQGLAKGEFQGFIEENEHVIFQIEFENDNVKIINLFYKDIYKGNLARFYNYINGFNYKLYKMILKSEEEDENNLNYKHSLELYDIIKIKEFKLLLRDYRINKKKSPKNKNPKFIIQINEAKHEEHEECVSCNKTNSSPDNPLINFYNEIKHLNCIKEEINQKTTNVNGKYIIKNPDNYPLFFIYDNKQYDLLDIPKNQNEDFLLFESLDYLDIKGNKIDKYIFYIKLDKNKPKEKILITSGENKNKIKEYDNLIELDENIIDNGKAVIECDKLNQNLILKNIGEENDISVLQENILLKPDNGVLYMNSANVKIEAKLISSNEFDDVEKEMEQNKEKIEERKE